MTQLSVLDHDRRRIAPNHHGSHLDLLKHADPTMAGPSTLDAVVVPIAHRSANLRVAVDLAAYLGCPLVVLCSKEASARAVTQVAAGTGVEIAAIDIAGMPDGLLPDFATHRLLSDTPFANQRDTSLKRNLALLLAGSAGWQRVFFLDADIAVPDPRDLVRAARLLDEYEVVGLQITDFPDNSVVCHANRDTGGRQATFIGGGALAVRVAATPAFFPDIYNEDWFFLLDGQQLRPSAVVGAALQERYDPYAAGRAGAEEFGDCLAEGLFWLLDQGYSLKDATESHWQEFLTLRRAFIAELIGRLGTLPTLEDADAMRTALVSALRRSEQITPKLCVDYLLAWREDRETWRRHLDNFGKPRRIHQHRDTGGVPFDLVLAGLGLNRCCRYLRRA